MTNRLLARRSKLRRFWQVLGVFWTLVAFGEIWALATGHRGDGWMLVNASFWVLIVLMNIGAPQVWQARLIQRSIERNRAQASGDT